MMMNPLNGPIRDASLVTLSLLAWQFGGWSAEANPTGGSVAQGSATFNASGSHLTVNTSANSIINWQSFNIGVGETTTFVQPSSTSVVWNHINDSNPSQILGSLDANGFVILQNQNGIYVGGAASIKTAGLVLTTSPAAPSLSSGGAWDFNALPPTVPIINYGQITTAGGPAYLIADSIQNYGAISAEQGQIGLYAGQHVLVSTRPDGRGLNAKVTLPQGSVDNEGRLVADGGAIVAQAKTVNNNGLLQANTVREVNGSIELLASDSVNLGANSMVSAQGENRGASAGGSVTIKSDNNFSDQPGSAINVSGGVQGGNGGQLEISASNLGVIQSQLDGHAASGFQGGSLTIDPTAITLNAATESADNALITSGGLSQFTVSADSITVSSSWTTPGILSQLNLVASGNITLSTGWTVANAGAASLLDLSAGNNIIFNTGSFLSAGNNWTLNLLAGTSVPVGTRPSHVSDGTQSDGIYLSGTSYLQTQNGNINCTAANEVLIASGTLGAIRTIGGGNIDVTATWGNVNSGNNPSGYNYYGIAPFYTPFSVDKFGDINYNQSSLGGISTAAGGNVTISAGGNVTSFFASSTTAKTTAIADPGAGAFGPEPGNVSITAGGNVFGDYLVANGAGSIMANQNIGSANQNVALSLVKGSWNLNAPNGDIYLQEVRNPNGVFDSPNSTTSPAYHYFDYDPNASVYLNAIGVNLTGTSLPRPVGSVPIIYPSTLAIEAASGGITLGANVILFPSVNQNLAITTTDGGNLNGLNASGNNSTLSMSDTSHTQWASNGGIFTSTDRGGTPLELNNPNPVLINISGDMDNLNLVTDERTQITVAGNMNNCSFIGQNLHSSDVSSITVAGQINNASSFNWVFLSQPIQAAPSSDWLPAGVTANFLSLLYAAVNPKEIATLNASGTLTTANAANEVKNNALLILPGTLDQMFTYSPATGRLTLIGPMTAALAAVLGQPLTLLKTDNNGNPLVINGQLQTDTVTYNWIPTSFVQSLYTASQGAPSLQNGGNGYIVGGPGEFDVQAKTISLGNSIGILTEGVGGKYAYLAPDTTSGANLNVTITGADQTETVNGLTTTIDSLEMPAATIAALGGGNVTVISQNGSMDLGSQDLLDAETLVAGQHNIALGIYTTGPGNVAVTAKGDINIDSSRVAAFNGGSVTVESLQCNVNAGSGGATASTIDYYYVDANGKAANFGESVYANGIVAETLFTTAGITGAKEKPGDITVTTPEGNIIANQGGILQEALDGNIDPGPQINLSAGSPGYIGNIDLGSSGVIGGSVSAIATGNITGLVISRLDSNIQAGQSFNGTVVAGRNANLSAVGDIEGTIVGIGGVNASGVGGVSAILLGSNVSANGGAAQNTLGTTATATSASTSASGLASNQAKQVAASENDPGDDDKKKKLHPLMQRVKRVTIILPKT